MDEKKGPLELNEIRGQKLYVLETPMDCKHCIISYIGKGIMRTYTGMTYSTGDYGTMWRLWTREPTKEESARVPWGGR